MQQQPQDAYPRFDQPGQPPAFTISHNNPYAQQNPSYIPPPQYGMPGQQPDPNQPKENNFLAQAELQEIDNQLSSGGFSCYYCWLYFVAVYSCLNFLQGVSGIAVAFWMIVLVIEAAVEYTYAMTMINVLKKKDLQKAELGVKLAFAVCGLMVGCLMIQGFLMTQLYGSEMVPYLLLAAVLLAGYYGGAIVLPALKIKALLERREAAQAALGQNSNLSSYNV